MVTDREKLAVRYFRSCGLALNGAAALVGNFAWETGSVSLDTTMFRAHPDASGGRPRAECSGGLAEWLGSRKAAELAFAKAAGKPCDDLLTQCAFVMFELKSDYPTLLRQLSDPARSPTNLAYNVSNVYERPNAAMAHKPERAKYAEEIAAACLRDEKPTPAPGAGAGAGVGTVAAMVHAGQYDWALAAFLGLVAAAIGFALYRWREKVMKRPGTALDRAAANFEAARTALDAARKAIMPELEIGAKL